MKRFLEHVKGSENDDSFEEGSLLPSERNDQRNYRKSISGSKVAMKYWDKSQKNNYEPSKVASVRAKKVHKGDYNA